jgi:hypothetical protein
MNPKLETNPNTRDGRSDLPDVIVPGAEPMARKYVGSVVRFDCRRAGGKTTEEKGEIVAQKWLGFLARGHVPEYEVTILGKSGKSVIARVSRDHVQTL